MGLKQNIVVVNEFSVKDKQGKGSRGSSPGNYVLRYMARKGATEDLAPVKYEDHDKFITKYMARKKATEKYESIPEIKSGMRKAQGLGGVAFGSSSSLNEEPDISMSHKKVKKVSKDIQKQFDEGKTVLKTVISFDQGYLKQMKVVEEDFEVERRGDYRGNIDQMKLRRSIMDGMKKLSKGFDDLEWIGVIQVDTEHVHCHLCMVDKGRGRVLPNGEQKGKLTDREMKVLRRGIDMSLDKMQPVKALASNITYDKRNTKCFIKKYTHNLMAENGTPQLLLACLPENRNLWRANTNRKEMLKPNAIVREFVTEVLEKPDSGFDKALRDVDAYAKERLQYEDLSAKEYRRLIEDGRERIITDCMNGVYSVLKTIPKEKLKVSTPMLDVMAMNYKDMAEEAMSDPMIEFGFKLRSYSSRLKFHRDERHKYKQSKDDFEKARDEGKTSNEAEALYNFYKVEEEYNAMLMAKYQHFLNFLPPYEAYEEEFNDLMKYRKRIIDLNDMLSDTNMKRMRAESAEDYGRKVYDQVGGRFMVTNPDILERRFDNMLESYDKKAENFQAHLEDYGLTFEANGSKVGVLRRPAYEFDSVKALDIHHLGFDFPYDAAISKPNVDMFVNMANIRFEAYAHAVNYLENTDQAEFIETMPTSDVLIMKATADKLSMGNYVIESKKDGNGGEFRRRKTIALDEKFEKDMELAVRQAVHNLDMVE